MKTSTWSSSSTLVMALALMLPAGARGDVLRVEGTVSTFSERIEGQSVSVLNFEIPTLRAGSGLVVVAATVDWEHGGIASYQRVRLEARDASQIAARGPLGPLSTSVASEVLSTPPTEQLIWHPRDFRRLGKCLLRFDMTASVTELLDSSESSFQLYIASEGLNPEALGTSARAPILTIRYGFMGELAGGSEGER